MEPHRAPAGENRGAPVDSHTGCVSFSPVPSGSDETVLTKQSFSPTFVQDAKRPVLHSCLLVELSDAALPFHSVCGELGVDVRHSFVVSDNVYTRMIGKACLVQPVFLSCVTGEGQEAIRQAARDCTFLLLHESLPGLGVDPVLGKLACMLFSEGFEVRWLVSMSPEVGQMASSTDWWADCLPVLIYQSVLLEPLAALLPGWHWVGPSAPSCSSQVASEQGFQRGLLAVELEVLLVYQAGHTAFLLSPVTEVDLEKAEIARCELLLALCAGTPVGYNSYGYLGLGETSSRRRWSAAGRD